VQTFAPTASAGFQCIYRGVGTPWWNGINPDNWKRECIWNDGLGACKGANKWVYNYQGEVKGNQTVADAACSKDNFCVGYAWNATGQLYIPFYSPTGGHNFVLDKDQNTQYWDCLPPVVTASPTTAPTQFRPPTYYISPTPWPTLPTRSPTQTPAPTALSEFKCIYRGVGAPWWNGINPYNWKRECIWNDGLPACKGANKWVYNYQGEVQGNQTVADAACSKDGFCVGYAWNATGQLYIPFYSPTGGHNFQLDKDQNMQYWDCLPPVVR